LDTPQGGYMILLPLYVPQGMTFTHASFALLPWTSPSFSGFVGTTTASPPEPVVAVTFEWPITWVRTIEEIPKPAREVLYVRRFSADQALATGIHAFSNVRPNLDPNKAPDTTVTTDQGELGVEVTCLTLNDRRQAHALFQLLRRRVLECEPALFAKLAGHVIYVWFEEPGGTPGLTLPLRKDDDEAVADLLQELASYTPQPGQMWVPSGPPPEQVPQPHLATTPKGARFYASPLIANAPSTMLFTFCGFELGLAYTSILTAEAAWEEIGRLVRKHDQVGVDILLITTSAPDQHGLIFPAEEAVANFLLEQPSGLAVPPNYIKRVFLHSWATGRAAELYPDVKTMFGPIYQAFQPEHFPLMNKVTETDDAKASS
jgi:hypothetical protein